MSAHTCAYTLVTKGATVGGHSFFVIDRDSMLANKRAAGRDKDLVDVAALERAGQKPHE